MKKNYRAETDCLNCGAVVQGNYCSVCGQQNIEVIEKFWPMITHSIGHYFHFDSKLTNTIGPLLTKPGYLTNYYISGKRNSYLHPIQTYLFISIVFFLLMPIGNDVNIKDKKLASKIKEEQISEKKLLESAAKDANSAGITIGKSTAGKEKHVIFNGWQLDQDSTIEAYEKRQNALPPSKRDNFFSHYANKQLLKITGKDSEKYVDKFIQNLPKLMFILLPLFAVILKLVFWRNRKYYIEHFVYSLHLHSFLFILFIILLILDFISLGFISGGVITLIAILLIIWYVYRSLRVVYINSRWRIIGKMLLLSLSYMTVFFFSLLMIVFILFFTI
ncbi:DUF3667 domain-containing protein [Daejeonella oryzae]|uniref:DUF3667 domain-containing protein n=1 Tax=Daejeonella oryzae TaxID=1122943 RepID=UPI00040DCE59|nr:DUF3667 domain-containing protein [Daejeonella oryzae]